MGASGGRIVGINLPRRFAFLELIIGSMVRRGGCGVHDRRRGLQAVGGMIDSNG